MRAARETDVLFQSREDASVAWALSALRCPGASASLRPWTAGKDVARVETALRALGRIERDARFVPRRGVADAKPNE